MCVNLEIFLYSASEMYYIIFDYAYWRVNYTPFPLLGNPPKPSFFEYMVVVVNVVFPLLFVIIANCFLWKKKYGKTLFVLSLFLIVVIFNYINCYNKGYCDMFI